MKEERFPHTRKPLHCRRLRGVGVGGELRSHGGERSHRGAEGKAERFPHRGSVPTSTHQPERLVCLPAGAGGGWELGAEARALESRSQGEDWGWLREHSLKGASAPQLAGRESGKKSGPAKEARDHCFGVHKERGFRTLPKQTPETGASISAWTPETGMKC